MTDAPHAPITMRPTVHMKPKSAGRVLLGHPWAFSNEIEMTSEARALPPGGLVRLVANDGKPVGTAQFNPHSLIAARLLDRDPACEIDHAFLVRRLRAALDLRGRLFSTHYYRLVHAEADRLPGLVIDRFDDLVVMQANTAGMERLEAPLLAALQEVIDPRAIVLRNDSPSRQHEGLSQDVRLVFGTMPETPLVREGGAAFPLDPMSGQKTGWFFDHRDNRAFIASLASGARVLDLYSHTGGFGIQCAIGGAASIDLIDRSAQGLALAEQAASLSGVAERVQVRKADAFAALEHLIKTGDQYDIVIADPPAFAKSKKDVGAATRAYRKLARLAAGVTAPGGLLLLASCSHHIDPASFSVQVSRGLIDAERTGRILRRAGAGADHPVHPQLPESAYLKCEVLALD